jgi:hypothetical protein
VQQLEQAAEAVLHKPAQAVEVVLPQPELGQAEVVPHRQAPEQVALPLLP